MPRITTQAKAPATKTLKPSGHRKTNGSAMVPIVPELLHHHQPVNDLVERLMAATPRTTSGSSRTRRRWWIRGRSMLDL
jgi:hypothetical protein